jgi:hypothetical protein
MAFPLRHWFLLTSTRRLRRPPKSFPDADALSALEAGLAEIERGETITLAELRKELAERRPTAS